MNGIRNSFHAVEANDIDSSTSPKDLVLLYAAWREIPRNYKIIGKAYSNTVGADMEKRHELGAPTRVQYSVLLWSCTFVKSSGIQTVDYSLTWAEPESSSPCTIYYGQLGVLRQKRTRES